jgi:endonuclease/exonuclease/phosphatase family metal-dependent hydrolase
VAFDPYAPYGPVVESTVRIVTWNVWGRYGDADRRQRDLEAVLAAVEPDVVCLVEAWATEDETQPARVAQRLGMSHSTFEGGWEQDGWTSGLGVASRWPIVTREHRPLPSTGGDAGAALFCALDGPRGEIHLFVAVLDYPLGASARRQAQVRDLCAFVDEVGSTGAVTVLCGDFNAGPDSDEIRMLTGLGAVPVPGLVFYDAWELAGDGGPGITWSNENALAAVGRYPDRRFDYVFSAWPRLGAAGHPVRCERLGVRPPDGNEISDHYGVLVELRY